MERPTCQCGAKFAYYSGYTGKAVFECGSEEGNPRGLCRKLIRLRKQNEQLKAQLVAMKQRRLKATP